MHFHLPKPLHGWRAFAGEVAIIVLGVMIALGAEQVVEDWHWRNEVMDAQRALDREAAYDLGAVEKRQQEVPCIDRRLREIRTLLTGDASGLRSGSRGPLGQPQLWRPRTDVWQVAVAGQAAEHMPLATRLGYAGLYGAFQWYAQKAEDETDAWSVLAELTTPAFSARRTSRRYDRPVRVRRSRPTRWRPTCRGLSLQARGLGSSLPPSKRHRSRPIL